MLEMIKKRCGISVSVYDEDIEAYITDCREDMLAAGVPERMLPESQDAEVDPQVLTAVTLYVKAYLGNDRSDTEKYMDLYRKKVFRLTLERDEEGCGTEA